MSDLLIEGKNVCPSVVALSDTNGDFNNIVGRTDVEQEIDLTGANGLPAGKCYGTASCV